MIYHEFTNKVAYVASQLREQIESGKLTPQHRLGTSKEIALEYGVSLMTADNAVRSLVKEGILIRSKGSGTWVARNKKVLRIAFMDSRNLSSEKNSILYNQNTYPILERECTRCGMQLFRVSSLNCPEAKKADGILSSIAPNPNKNPLLPFAYFRDYRLLNRPYIQVVPDLTNVMNSIFRRLLRQNIKPFYVTMSTSSNIRSFGEIFISFAKWYGIDNKDLHISLEGVHQNEAAEDLGYRYGMQLPELKNAAIFSTSDFRSTGIIRALDQRGIPPQSYHLISCNNWENYAYRPFDEPRLTSIDFRREEMFIKLIDLLHQAILHKDAGYIHIVKIPAVLKIRQSAFANSLNPFLSKIHQRRESRPNV